MTYETSSNSAVKQL